MPNTDPRSHPDLPKIGSHWPNLTQAAVRHKIGEREIAPFGKVLILQAQRPEFNPGDPTWNLTANKVPSDFHTCPVVPMPTHVQNVCVI